MEICDWLFTATSYFPDTITPEQQLYDSKAKQEGSNNIRRGDLETVFRASDPDRNIFGPSDLDQIRFLLNPDPSFFSNTTGTYYRYLIIIMKLFFYIELFYFNENIINALTCLDLNMLKISKTQELSTHSENR